MSIITTARHTKPSLQPPAFKEARMKHLVLNEHLHIPEWDDNNLPLVKSVINKLERGAMPLPALLWDAYDPVRPRSSSQTPCFRTYSIWLAEEISERENGDGVVVDEDDTAFLPTLCVRRSRASPVQLVSPRGSAAPTTPKPAANNYVSIVLDPAGNVALVLFPPTRKRSLSGDSKQDAPVSFFRVV